METSASAVPKRFSRSAPRAGGAAVTLRNLHLRYGDVVAVDDVSIEVQAGEFLTLLGPSGSGKTTTLKMVAGFEMPDSGQIVVDGRDITHVPPHDRNIGMVFQNYALFPHMSVFDNVAFPLKMRKRPKDEIRAAVAKALDLVQLGGFRARYPRQLSGGQQQRVALARAIVFEPRLLLMDEPLGALDKQLRTQVQTEIKRIQENLGVSVVYVTHDQEEALFLSDRIALMNAGRIEQLGSPSELYRQPVNRFVAQFLGESNFLGGIVDSVADGYVRVRLAGGVVIRGRASAPVSDGQAVEIAVRPEHFRVADADGVANALPVTIRRRHFVGEAIRLECVTGDGHVVNVKLLSFTGQVVPDEGAKSLLTWSADDTRVFSV